MSAPSTPHFICIGSQKAGTGWVYGQFDARVDFVMPPMKELQFFNNRFLGKEKRERACFKLAALEKRPPAGRDAEADRRFIERVLSASPAGFNAKVNRPRTRPMPDALKAVAVGCFAEEAPALAGLLGGHATGWAEELERDREALRRATV